jgi:2-hydroxychromene-2-carboxylate isomerase
MRTCALRLQTSGKVIPSRTLALADGDEVVRRLGDATEEAHELGLFGSPSFVVGHEVFWGDDHLEDAFRWAKHGRL